MDNSATAHYTGLAIGTDGVDSFIYAANFHSGKIEIYDTAWNRVNKPFAFMDFFLPHGYAHSIFKTSG